MSNVAIEELLKLSIAKRLRLVGRRVDGMVCMALLALSLAACAHSPPENGPAPVVNYDPATRPAAIVRASTLRAEGEQAYIVLYADGGASGLIVVYAEAGLLYGTGVPDSWTWLDGQRVEICASVDILRNDVGFPPMERDCAPHSITGKELDLDGDGDVDLIETFTVLDPAFYTERPAD